MNAKLTRRAGPVHGSVYPGPAKLQDKEYAAKVVASQKKAASKVKSE